MTKKELEPLLINSDQVRQLTGLTVETLTQIEDFPRPVRLERPRRYYGGTIMRNLWKRKEVEKWVNKLEEKWV